jgi:hypothetical protein
MGTYNRYAFWHSTDRRSGDGICDRFTLSYLMDMDKRGLVIIGFALALLTFFVLPEAVRYFHGGALAGDEPSPPAAPASTINGNCNFPGGTNNGTINCPSGTVANPAPDKSKCPPDSDIFLDSNNVHDISPGGTGIGMLGFKHPCFVNNEAARIDKGGTGYRIEKGK